jgi:hypothetical protein
MCIGPIGYVLAFLGRPGQANLAGEPKFFRAADACVRRRLHRIDALTLGLALREAEGFLLGCASQPKECVMIRFVSTAITRRSCGSTAIVAAALLAAAVQPVIAGISADQATLVGTPDAGRPNASAAVGPIEGDTSFGGLNPFNPAFDDSQIVILDPASSLTLHLSGEVPANGRNLGVFANVGIVDSSQDGSGLAGSPPSIFSQDLNGNNAFPQAVVSVSRDGVNYATLNQGQPIAFTNPANYYLDSNLSNDFQPLGTVAANPYKPFLGTLDTLSGQSYPQMKTTLNGSAGGTWLDLSGTGLASINYVRFSVPADATYHMVLDAVTGMSAAKSVVAGQPVISESVGNGSNTSSIVVDFGPQSYDFQVHYDGSITGEQALQLLNDDSAFRLTAEHFSFGDFVTGLDYGGYVDVGDGSNGNDFWDYYTSASGSSWSASGIGAGTRLLTNGSWDGWVWNAAQTFAPDMPIAPVPEPTMLGLGMATTALLMRRRR